MIHRFWRFRNPVVLAATLVVVVLVAAVGSDYWLYTLSEVAIYAVVAIGFNAALGQAGQVTFGQVAFMAVGAYTSAILTTKAHWNPIVALVCSVVLGGILSLLVSIPFLRLRGHYLAMATLAFALGIQSLASNASGLTGGAIGLPNIPPLSIGGVVIDTQPNILIVLWLLCGLCLLVYYLVVNSHIGRSWRAIAARPDVAASLGIPVDRRKLLALVIAGSMAALSGSLYAEFLNYVSPDFFNIVMIGNIFFMVIVGGLGSIAGPLVGAAIIVILPGQLSGLGQWAGVVVTLVLLAVLVLLPTGLLGDSGSVATIRNLLPARLQNIGLATKTNKRVQHGE
jgi:branched-chain amino acid transport system permease protein